MKPVDQTERGHNCLCACLASLLELGMGDIPDFPGFELNDGSWKPRVEEWLRREHNYTMIDFYIEYGRGREELCYLPAMYHIISGLWRKKGRITHAVVGFQGKIVHDPHPQRAGLLCAYRHTFLIPVSSRADFGKLFSRV